MRTGGVRSSQGFKEAVVENLASNMMQKKEKNGIVELYYDFPKAYDNVNHAFLEELLDVYGFPYGIQSLIVEMMARWKNRQLFGAREMLEKFDSQTASFRAIHSLPCCLY